jgi:histone chaperone ASF1
MSIINVTNVVVRRNPAPLTDPFEFEVFFECLHPLSLDIEWKLVYVGDAEEKSKDQVACHTTTVLSK